MLCWAGGTAGTSLGLSGRTTAGLVIEVLPRREQTLSFSVLAGACRSGPWFFTGRSGRASPYPREKRASAPSERLTPPLSDPTLGAQWSGRPWTTS